MDRLPDVDFQARPFHYHSGANLLTNIDVFDKKSEKTEAVLVEERRFMGDVLASLVRVVACCVSSSNQTVSSPDPYCHRRPIPRISSSAPAIKPPTSSSPTASPSPPKTSTSSDPSSKSPAQPPPPPTSSSASVEARSPAREASTWRRGTGCWSHCTTRTWRACRTSGGVDTTEGRMGWMRRLGG